MPEGRGLHIRQIHLVCLKAVFVPAVLHHLHTQFAQKADQVLNIEYVRNIIYADLFVGQQTGTNNLQGFILCPLGGYFAGHPAGSVDLKTAHASTFTIPVVAVFPGIKFTALTIVAVTLVACRVVALMHWLRKIGLF